MLPSGSGSISMCKCLPNAKEGRASGFTGDLETVEAFDSLEERWFGGNSFSVEKGFACSFISFL